jgi:hypothetical protein
MLLILRDHAKTGRTVLVLQGRLVDGWAEVLERECAEAGRSDVPVALDLSALTYVSPGGLAALARLCRGGVGIDVCPPLIAEMLEQEGVDVGRCGEADP